MTIYDVIHTLIDCVDSGSGVDKDALHQAVAEWENGSATPAPEPEPAPVDPTAPETPSTEPEPPTPAPDVPPFTV